MGKFGYTSLYSRHSSFLGLFAVRRSLEVDGITKYRPNPIPPGDDDHRAIGEYSNVLHVLPAEHSRTDTQHFTGVPIDELGKVIGEDRRFPAPAASPR